MTTPIEQMSGLVIGQVESVSPAEIHVMLEMEAPHATALNTGTPTAFPRINGYVLVPNEAGATVGYISWIGIERSPYPKRAGLKDFDLIDLPFPHRKMTISPVATLTCRRDRSSGKIIYDLQRGIVAFPSVGDQVLMPTPDQVEAIVGANNSERRIRIGASTLASNAAIKVEPDKLFGRHLAVLGNTGSGKSCTVAGLIRWSMEAADGAINDPNKSANMRFIVLDPNGEYAKAFADKTANVRLFRVPPVGAGERPLDVPAWLWNGHEWTAVTYAQPGVQRPLLMQGIRELKRGQATPGAPRPAIIRQHLVNYSAHLSAMISAGPQAYTGDTQAKFNCASVLQSIAGDCDGFADDLQQERVSFLAASGEIRNILDSRRAGQSAFYNYFLISDLETTRDRLTELADALPQAPGYLSASEDDPCEFDIGLLPRRLEGIASQQGGNVAGFVSTLGLRIRGMLNDPRLVEVIGRQPATTFVNWLEDYVGADGASNGQLAIIDLSLVPTEIVHVVVSVFARLIFESLQRYRRHNPEGLSLPTALVVEEAHAFIQRGRADEGPASSPVQLCRETFERIAREGRKFGLGLVLSSQRPSELSQTVLAQCNTFLLHRIVNDADQNLVARLVPDNVGALLGELPSLPSRQAILLGWATPIPVLVEIDELPVDQRPQSSDPDFWDVWTLAKERTVNWPNIVGHWAAPTPAAKA